MDGFQKETDNENPYKGLTLRDAIIAIHTVQSSKNHDNDNIHTGHCRLSYWEKKWDGKCEGDVQYNQGEEEGHSKHQHGGYQIDQVIEAPGQHQPFITIKLYLKILLKIGMKFGQESFHFCKFFFKERNSFDHFPTHL